MRNDASYDPAAQPHAAGTSLTRESKRRAAPIAILTAACLWILFASLYLLLRSNQYTAVDGALRCLQVYWGRSPYVGPNNHMLYPFNVWCWSRLAGLLGFHARSPLGFLHMTQAMNAIAAGGAVAIVDLIVERFTLNRIAAIAAASGYAFSWAMLLHGTNSAEPIVGLFVSLVATLIVVEGLARCRPVLLFVGGACLAIALANYESMVLIAPLIFVLCLFWPSGNVPPYQFLTAHPACVLARPDLRQIMRRLFSCGLGASLGLAMIYPAAYYSTGFRSPQMMARAFLQMGGDPGVYGGFRLAKIANFPIGLAGNLIRILPDPYHGIRWLLDQDGHHPLAIAAIAAVITLAITALFVLAAAAFELSRQNGLWLWAIAIVAAILIDFAPLLYWDPLYNKLWLQPLALIFALMAILGPRSGQRLIWGATALAILTLALELSINLPAAVAASRAPTRCLGDAKRLAAEIRPQDKVLTDFNAVSSLWMALYDNDPSRTLLVPASPPAVSLEVIADWTKQCAVSGCKIFFVGLLNESRQDWEAFLGHRVGLPFDALKPYRQLNLKVEQFACEDSSFRVYSPRR
jgi:hypothetical protein